VGLTPLALALAAAAASDGLGAPELHRLDRLPRFRESVYVGSVSSYDRSGGNDDGFSGRYSFVRREDEALVLADLKGPGFIYRVHTPTPTDDLLELYLDGESDPSIRLPFRQLFTGERSPFLAPLVGSGAGGNYSYVPIAYRTSCKVVLRARTLQFYQINYATYPEGTPVPSWDTGVADELEPARGLWSSAGEDVHRYTTPPGAVVTPRRVVKSLAPGEATTLFDLRDPGRIVGLRLRPAAAFTGPARSIVLRIFWDDSTRPAVEVPVGDFFGYSFGEPATRSILVGTSGETNYAYFPMPFDRAARVELVAEGTNGAIEVEAELLFAPVPRAPDEGKFYAVWRRENPTTMGKPFTFVRARGRGHVVGAILQAQGPEAGHTRFFEGDDVAVLDGKLAIHGTGSEDFFNGGWYDVAGRWDRRISFPVSGSLDYKKHLGRTGAYRLLLSDAYPYRESIDFTIEHAPEGNDITTDYTAVTFLYSAEAPTDLSPLPPVSERRVRDIDRVVFSPGWNVPIRASSLEDAVLAKKVEEIGGEEVRMLSLKATGEDIFGPHHVAFELEVPSAGRYRVLLEGVLGPEQGRVRLYRDENPLGEAVDLFAAERSKSGPLSLGEVDLDAGVNVLFFRSAGKSARSRGIGLDLVTIVLERVSQ
jgi:hypothetical protein